MGQLRKENAQISSVVSCTFFFSVQSSSSEYSQARPSRWVKHKCRNSYRIQNRRNHYLLFHIQLFI